MAVLTTSQMSCLSAMQLFQIPGNAQAKIEDVSRLLLNQVSQMPSKMPSSLKQGMTTNNQPFADMSKKLAVRFQLRQSSTHVSISLFDCFVVVTIAPT